MRRSSSLLRNRDRSLRNWIRVSPFTFSNRNHTAITLGEHVDFTVAPDEWAEYETCRATPNSTGQPTPAPPLSPGSHQSSGPPSRARTGALPGSKYLAWQIQRPVPIKCHKLDRAPTAAGTSPAPLPLIRTFEMSD